MTVRLPTSSPNLGRRFNVDSCQNCGMEDGQVLKVIKARNPKDNIEIKYAGGFCDVSGRIEKGRALPGKTRLLCWFCTTPNVGAHL